MDLLNEDNVSPADVDTTRLEDEWFNHSDPYDLAESDRVDATNPDDLNIVRCSTKWKAADFVKLISASLTSLMKYFAGDKEVSIISS